MPCVARVVRGVQVDFGVGEIGGNRISGKEDGASWESAERLGKDVEERLVAEAPVINLVRYIGNLFLRQWSVFKMLQDG